jgi:hypothetical protein
MANASAYLAKADVQYPSLASELQRPSIIIVYRGMPLRYMVMAAAEWLECGPMSLVEKPRFSLPIGLEDQL